MGENKENGIFKTLACNSVVEKGALAMAQAIGIAPNERLLYYSSLACATSFPNNASSNHAGSNSWNGSNRDLQRLQAALPHVCGRWVVVGVRHATHADA